MLFFLLACTPGSIALGSSPFTTTREADVRTDDTGTLTYEGDAAGECADGADNDRDNLYDCADPNCSGSSDCPPAVLDTDTDTDADTDTDTDSDTDSDTDADTDSDTDADTASEDTGDPTCTGITVDPIAISIPATRGAYEARVRIIGCATGLSATAESVVLGDGRSWETSWTSVPAEVDGEVTLSLLYYGSYDETTTGVNLTAQFSSDQGDTDTFVLSLY